MTRFLVKSQTIGYTHQSGKRVQTIVFEWSFETTRRIKDPALFFLHSVHLLYPWITQGRSNHRVNADAIPHHCSHEALARDALGNR